jgi:uncharacterized OB-fold protein
MAEKTNVPATPRPVLGFHDGPFWEHVRARSMALQRCDGCGAFRHPPSPACPACLSEASHWEPVSGRGTIISWVVFHRQYLPAYPAPYNVIAVRLAEGPVMVSNLEGDPPERTWIGAPVRLVYATMPDGAVLPRFTLDRPAT